MDEASRARIRVFLNDPAARGQHAVSSEPPLETERRPWGFRVEGKAPPARAYEPDTPEFLYWQIASALAPLNRPVTISGVDIRKIAIVARLLRGEPLELVARETNVSIARLTEWRERALAGAATALKERERDDRDDEIARLKSKVGEITMDNELLNAKIAALEGKRPLAHRRSRR